MLSNPDLNNPVQESATARFNNLGLQLRSYRDRDGIKIPLPATAPTPDALEEIVNKSRLSFICKGFDSLGFDHAISTPAKTPGEKATFPSEKYLLPGESIFQPITFDINNNVLESTFRREMADHMHQMDGRSVPVEQLNSGVSLGDYNQALLKYAERLGVNPVLLPISKKFDFLHNEDLRLQHEAEQKAALEKEQQEKIASGQKMSPEDLERQNDEKDAMMGIRLLMEMKRSRRENDSTGNQGDSVRITLNGSQKRYTVLPEDPNGTLKNIAHPEK